MTKTVFLVLLLSAGILSNAQPAGKPLKKVLELKMPKTADDDMPGTRGASVAWHPAQKKYYASFAGNIGYPMGVFDIKGKRLSGDDLTTMADTRGLWYDPTTKLICGNGYNDFGWFAYKLDTKGIPVEAEIIYGDDMYQPGDQSVGVYNTVAKKVMFLHDGLVYMYNADGEAQDTLVINWGLKKGEEVDEYNEDEYNGSLIYTGVKGQELGFLNITDNSIELYDMKTGYLTRTIALPEEAPLESMFNFAYANGIYWLFSIADRTWIGYK